MYTNNSSVSRDFLPRHVNKHSKQSIYETNIFNVFNDFKKFFTIINSSGDYNFVFSHSFKFYANFDDNLLILEYILTLCTELITVFVQMFSLIISITKSFGKLLRYWYVLTHLFLVDKFIGYL